RRSGCLRLAIDPVDRASEGLDHVHRGLDAGIVDIAAVDKPNLADRTEQRLVPDANRCGRRHPRESRAYTRGSAEAEIERAGAVAADLGFSQALKVDHGIDLGSVGAL